MNTGCLPSIASQPARSRYSSSVGSARYGHLAIARHRAAGGEMVGDHLEPGGQHLLVLVVEADRHAGKVVHERLHAVVEQRHPVLHARMAPAVGDGEVDRVLGRFRTEQLAPPLAEAADAVAVERDLGHRAQHEAVDPCRAALGGGVEGADALDLVTEQVEAQRVGAAGREQVDDAAAHRVFAGLHDGAGANVAVAFEEARELLGPDHAAGGELAAAALEDVAGRHALHQGVDRGQHDARPGGGLEQAGECRDPLSRHDGGVGARRGRTAGSPRPGSAAPRPRARRRPAPRPSATCGCRRGRRAAAGPLCSWARRASSTASHPSGAP